MPILVYKNNAFVVSRSQFLDEYKKLHKIENSTFKDMSNPYKKFIFHYAAQAIAGLYQKAKEDNKNNHFYPSIYRFNYYDKEAQDVVIELLLFFSHFYYSVKIFDGGGDGLQNITDYLLPRSRLYFTEKSYITIKKDRMQFSFQIKQIRQINGLVNNFVLYLDNARIHFCSDFIYSDNRLGKFIRITPDTYDIKGTNKYSSDYSDYIFKRNRPNRFKLMKYRKMGFLVIMQ